MRFAIVKVVDVRRLLPRINLAEKTSCLVFGGLENFIEFVQACIQLPKKAMLLCLRLPKQLVMLPFNVINKVFVDPLMHLMKMKSVPIITLEIFSPTRLLTGEDNPSPEKIIAACREIRCSTLRSLSKKQKQSTSQICDYKQQLDKWKLESEKRTEEIFKIGAEDKELMKSVASGLRSLKVLKNKRELMHINFNRSISAMINEGTVTAEKLLALKKLIKVGDANILEKKNAVLDLVSYGRLDDLTDSGYASPVKEDHLPVDRDSDASVETLKKVLELVSEENSLLRSQLTCTLDKLEEILSLSKNINNEVVTLDEKFTKMGSFNNEMESLQDKLDTERALLLAVQADRDFMKSKLKTLENLIKEEEEFLGESRFEIGFGDSECSLSTDLDVSECSSSSS